MSINLDTFGRIHRVYEDAAHKNDKSTYKYYTELIKKAEQIDDSVEITPEQLLLKRTAETAPSFIDSLAKNDIQKEHQYRMHVVPDSIKIDNY
jgi:hypothetical protein